MLMSASSNLLLRNDIKQFTVMGTNFVEKFKALEADSGLAAPGMHRSSGIRTSFQAHSRLSLQN
jgi:hypothetical protein